MTTDKNINQVLDTEAKRKAYRARHIKDVGGLYLGFESLDQHLQFVPGTPMIWTGLPNMGKTEFIKEIQINLSQWQEKKHFVFSPEGSGADNYINDLIRKIVGKPVYVRERRKMHMDDKRENKFAMTESEYANALDYVFKYFTIVERSDFPNPKSITVQDIYNLVDFSGEFDTITIDNYAGLAVNKELSIADSVADISQTIKEYDQKRKTSTFLVVHAANAPNRRLPNGRYYPEPTLPSNLQGGQNWERLADVIVQMYQPHKDIAEVDENIDYPAWLLTQKIRESNSGKKGLTEFGWCPKREGRYYEIIDGKRYYAFEFYEEQNAQKKSLPLSDWTQSESDAPF